MFEGALYNMHKGQATRGIPIIMHCYDIVTMHNNDGPACRLDFFYDSVRRLQTLVVSFREVVV